MDFTSLLEMAISNSDFFTTALILAVIVLQTYYSNRHTTCDQETLARLTKLEQNDQRHDEILSEIKEHLKTQESERNEQVS